MKNSPAFVLLVFLMVCFSGTPSGSAGPSSPSGLTPASGAGQSFLFVPTAGDAGAFFFRFHVEHTACVAIDMNATMALSVPLPWLHADAHGLTRHLPDAGDVDTLDGWSASADFDREPGTSHLMVNGTVVQQYEETGYDETSNRRFVRASLTLCGLEPEPADRWASSMITAPVRNATVALSFYEHWEYTNGGATFRIIGPGNATGTVTFASESNRTFLKELRDFHGTASANGDPLQHGAGPSAAAANVETTITTMRGFLGGFLDYDARPGGYNEASVLSYQGPGGEVGAGSDVAPGSPVPKALLLHIAGSAGDWRFRAHAYAAPRSFSSLMVWGADIETRTPNPNLDRADADRDGVPDEAEGAICYVQDDNRDLDGRCPNPPDYEPPPGTPNPRRL